MFGFRKAEGKKGSEAMPPEGVDELLFCVFDEKRREQHRFSSSRSEDEGSRHGPDDVAPSLSGLALEESIRTRRPVAVAFTFGEGQRKFLHVLPFERRRDTWRYACIQIATARPDPDSSEPPCVSALAEGRICLLLANAQNTIISACSRVPDAFGYTYSTLVGMELDSLFSATDLGVIAACSPDTNQSILSCVFQCLDGSKREVEIKKYSAPDHCILFAICDVAQPDLLEEASQVGIRERRRIGQDLHDSIGQLLTGISLLSRSLANRLLRDGHAGEADAGQISELADTASNQIRQISRGLMPTEVVQKGLFESLRELARTTSETSGIHCEARIDESVAFADSAVETHLFRIAQEAVTNSIRHAGASRIGIRLALANGMPRMEVDDNGTWKESASGAGGIGMKTMEYRAAAIGARLKVGAGDQGGTRVVCQLEAEDLFATRI